jgi:hypothetical protein
VFRWPGLGGYCAAPDDLLAAAEERVAAADTACRLVRAKNELLREECARLAADLAAVSTFLVACDELGDADAATAADKASHEVWWPEGNARA